MHFIYKDTKKSDRCNTGLPCDSVEPADLRKVSLRHQRYEKVVFCHIGMHFIYKDTKKSDRCKTSGYLLIRYADGVMPVWLRKYLPKNDWLGKLRQ